MALWNPAAIAIGLTLPKIFRLVAQNLIEQSSVAVGVVVYRNRLVVAVCVRLPCPGRHPFKRILCRLSVAIIARFERLKTKLLPHVITALNRIVASKAMHDESAGRLSSNVTERDRSAVE
jgi:hypothetical protein